ncbi:MAG: DUF1232 domain-containing protein [Acidobacteriota bacterium]|nr:DUF1232 domain-containing protein [Acidobacteriota bacterium]
MAETVKNPLETGTPASGSPKPAGGDRAEPDPLLAEREADRALAAGTDLPSTGLLSFYDRLREKVLHLTEGHGRPGKLSESAVKALLLAPDIFILMVRLTLDKEVPGKARALIGGALAYFILPYDLFPEAILGGVGYLDDLVLAVAVLSQTFGGELEPFARKHWSGPGDLREVLRDISETAESLVGYSLYGRLRRLLARHGIHLPPQAERKPSS